MDAVVAIGRAILDFNDKRLAVGLCSIESYKNDQRHRGHEQSSGEPRTLEVLKYSWQRLCWVMQGEKHTRRQHRKNIHVLYNAMSSSFPSMSILVSAKYPPFDLSRERVTPRRVESESRASCPTLFKKMNRTKRACSGKRHWPVWR